MLPIFYIITASGMNPESISHIFVFLTMTNLSDNKDKSFKSYVDMNQNLLYLIAVYRLIGNIKNIFF